VADKRDALTDSLGTLLSDLKSLGETLVRDPKEQAKKERLWRALYAVTGAVFTLAARRLATKTWSILTGEQPPTKRQAAPALKPEARPEPEPADSERETIATS
jgi:hypothetical protein